MRELFSKPLDISAQQELLEKKRDWILRACTPLKMIFFGSAARLQMTTSSDIDILLIFPDSADLATIRKSVYRARPLDDWPQDLMFYTESQYLKSVASGGGAAYSAHHEGKLLFSQDSI